MKSLLILPLLALCALCFTQCKEEKKEDTNALVVKYKGKTYDVYTIAPSSVKMAWKDGDGKILGDISALEKMVTKRGATLCFAMNGGMYDGDHAPCGLYIEDGKVVHNANKGKGKGNFYVPFCETQTNGIFLVKKDGSAAIVKTIDYQDGDSIQYATQSGPILLYNNKVNTQPEFSPKSTFYNERNAVGVNADGDAVFVKSRGGVTFHELATLFASELNCANALYLDGAISDMFIDGVCKSKEQRGLGVLIYTTRP